MQIKSMKTICAFVTALGLTWSAWVQAAKQDDPTEQTVAIVNGQGITQADFDREMRLARGRFSMQGVTPTKTQLSELRDRVLNHLIDRELLFQESEKRGIKVDEADIQKQLAALKDRLGAEEAYTEMLIRTNLSEGEVRSQIRRTMTIQKFIESRFVAGTRVSEDEVRDYYDRHADLFRKPEQIRASHILVTIDAKKGAPGKARARKEIKAVQQKLGQGRDFAELAKEFSKCPSAAKGGDLGFFPRGQMVKPFDEAAFALEPGEVSEIVETRFGYHLIKVTEKKPADAEPYNDVKGQIAQHLREQKVGEEVDQYVERLKEKAEIRKMTDN